MYHPAQAELASYRSLLDLHARLAPNRATPALQTVAECAQQATDAISALILTPGIDTEGTLTVAACAGNPADELLDEDALQLKARQTIDTALVTVGSITSQHPSPARPQRPEAREPMALALPSILAAPMQLHGQIHALVLIRASYETPFGTADAAAIKTYAAEATKAVQAFDDQRARQAQALSEDRERIARDLHDHVIQPLFASELQLSALVELLNTSTNAEVVERILHTVVGIDDAIRHLRRSIFNLTSA